MAEKKIIIGLVGKKGCGKDLFYKYLRNLDDYARCRTEIRFPRIEQIKSSDILINTLKTWNLPVTRENMQKLPEGMENIFGKGALSNAIYPVILNCNTHVVVFDAVRKPTDIRILKRFSPSFLVYIIADEKVRYERIKNRGEKPEEKDLSFEQFQKEERAATEILIDQLGAVADVKIENNGTLEQFAVEVKKFYDKYLKAVI